MNTSFNVVINPYNQNKLSAHIEIVNDSPVRYRYMVQGKTSDTHFTYSTDEYILNPVIPVVGLYAHYENKTEIVLITIDGDEETLNITISTLNQDYGDTSLKLSINIYDTDVANITLGQGWFITSKWNGYDINGDLRITGLYPWLYGNLKIIDNALFSANSAEVYDPDKHAFAPNLYKINLLGKIIQTYTAPEGYGFHHDITLDNEGHLFILGTIMDNWSDAQKLDSILYKYDVVSGELLWKRDYSTEFMGSTVLDNTDINDVHFNSLEYVKQTNHIIVNSRSTCTIMGLDPNSGDMQWIIDNPAYPTLNDEINLKALYPESFKYTNGEHSVFLTSNTKYKDFSGEGQFVLSLFNNNSCADEQGEELVRLIESEPVSYTAANLDSLPTIFAVNLNDRTVQKLDEFEFPGQRSEFTSSVFDINDHFSVYFGAEQTFFVFDNENKVVLDIAEIDTDLGYRGRIMSYEQLRTLI